LNFELRVALYLDFLVYMGYSRKLSKLQFFSKRQKTNWNNSFWTNQNLIN